MINKYTLSRNQNVNYVKANLEELIRNNLALSRYEEDDPERQVAYRNFAEAYDFILNNPEVENDYKCLLKLHGILMRGLDNGIKAELSQKQIDELNKLADFFGEFE